MELEPMGGLVVAEMHKGRSLLDVPFGVMWNAKLAIVVHRFHLVYLVVLEHISCLVDALFGPVTCG